MELLVLFFAVVAAVYARPDADFGSSYSAPPSDSYSAPLDTSYTAPVNNIYTAPPSTSGKYGAPPPVYGVPSQPPTIHKHVYVHVPPPEPQEYKPPRIISVAAPQKHYKIIFIKAPTPPTPTVPVIPPQAQNEEKTLVYVLVKKPDEAPPINIPTPKPTQPSKPEVYFIRYKTQKQEQTGYQPSGVPESQYGTPSTNYGTPRVAF